MANTLRDQLLGAGVIDKKQAKKARLDKHLQYKKQKKSGQLVEDQNKHQILLQKQQKAERDRQLNQQKEAKAQQKAAAAQIKQLIQMNAISRTDADTDYRFTHDEKIKTIFVSKIQQQYLANGQVAIAILDDGYELVPLGVAERIALRDASKLIIQEKQDSVVDEADPYADFEIPDDLMW
jgi:hypothetical protein